MSSPTETTVETRTVLGRKFDIVLLVWPDGGTLYDVYVHHAESHLDLLTDDESLEKVPTDDEIRDLMLNENPCYFCGRWAGDDYHLFGEDDYHLFGENVDTVSCEGCWDQRLR